MDVVVIDSLDFLVDPIIPVGEVIRGLREDYCWTKPLQFKIGLYLLSSAAITAGTYIHSTRIHRDMSGTSRASSTERFFYYRWRWEGHQNPSAGWRGGGKKVLCPLPCTCLLFGTPLVISSSSLPTLHPKYEVGRYYTLDCYFLCCTTILLTEYEYEKA